MIKILIPVRCVSCGKPIGGLWEKFRQRTEAGEPAAKVLDSLGLERYCCRAIFLTHRDTLKEVAKFRV